MTEQGYLTQRAEDQIAWYEGRSGSAQTWFKRLRTLEIVASAIVPLLAGYSTQSLAITVIIGVLGAVVAVIAALLSLHQFQERWLSFRATAGSLKRERFLYLTRSPPYTEAEPFPRFVLNVESLLGQEAAVWAQSNRAAPSPDGQAGDVPQKPA